MKIIIPGIPIAKARHKLCRRGNFPAMYDPQETKKKFVRQKIQAQHNDSFLPDWKAYKINLIFFMPFHNETFPWMPSPHICKPDLDNLEKFILDCCSGILYRDDKQIVEISSKKLYSDQPRTEIEIMPLPYLEVDENVLKVMKIFDENTLKEMVKDFKELTESYSRLSHRNNSKDYETLLTQTSALLIKVSRRYTEKLNKIKKMEEIPCAKPYECALNEHPSCLV